VTSRAAIAAFAAVLLSASVSAQSESSYFAKADLNHDGKLSLAEFQDFMSYAFKRMDTNHDRVIDTSEQVIPNAKRITLDEHYARLEAQFKRQDKNHDGFLSQREFLAPPG
jgi:Ca2+-binding EF-hand superfamily protein